MFLTLFSSRWVLNDLGEDDYGLFNVVGAIIVFITFLNGVFASSASRFFAYYIHDKKEVNTWFNVSISIHLFLSLILVFVGCIGGELCILYFLNIPPGRMYASLIVFRFSLIAAFFNMNAIPFTAMFIATQRMVIQAFFNVFNTLLIFLFALTLENYSGDRLCYYAAYMCGITVLLAISEIITALKLFPECRIHPSMFMQWQRMAKLFSFAGWQLFGNLGYVLRNQGTAILVNKYFGTTLNSSYGVANQVSAQSMTVSTALTTAFAPEITSTCGEKKEHEFEKLALTSCLFGTYLAMLFSVPLCMEIKYVLELWLKNPPPFTAGLCVLVIIAFLIDKTTSGIGSALLANGKIALFQVVDGVLLTLSVPVIWLFFALGSSPLALGYAFVGMRLSCMISRLYSPAGSIPRCLRRIRIENVFASGSFRAVNGRA